MKLFQKLHEKEHLPNFVASSNGSIKASCCFSLNSKSSLHPSSCFSLDSTSFPRPSNCFSSYLESSIRLTKRLSCCIWALYSSLSDSNAFSPLSNSFTWSLICFFYDSRSLTWPLNSPSLESNFFTWSSNNFSFDRRSANHPSNWSFSDLSSFVWLFNLSSFESSSFARPLSCSSFKSSSFTLIVFSLHQFFRKDPWVPALSLHGPYQCFEFLFVLSRVHACTVLPSPPSKRDRLPLFLEPCHILRFMSLWTAVSPLHLVFSLWSPQTIFPPRKVHSSTKKMILQQ